MTKKHLLVLIALVVGLGIYGYVDARRRARIDRGPRFHRTDFTVYQYASRALADGDDLYAARNPRGYRYVYPPLLAVLLQPIAHWDPADAAYLFFWISAIALVLALSMLARVPFGAPATDGLRRPLGGRAVLLALGLCIGFAHQSFQRGQVTHLLLGLQVGALVCCLGRRFFWAGLLLALGAALRLTPLLPAAAVGMGLLAGMRRSGASPVLRYAAGLGGGLALFFWFVPVLFLGQAQASEVTNRWLDVTQDVYVSQATPEALLDEYKINEFRFKNQAPRRVMGSVAGVVAGVAFEKEIPALTPTQWQRVNDGARLFGLTVLISLLLLAWLRMSEPGVSQYTATYALAVFAPVLITRYTWPTHYLFAIPMLAVIAWLALQGERAARLALMVFLGGAALFYAAHAKELQLVGAAGPLLLASLYVVVRTTMALLRRAA